MIIKKLSTSWLGEAIALLSGMLLTFSFAPFGVFPLAIICCALLLLTWLEVSEKRAFWRGFLFGLGLFGTGVSWVFISVYQFGNAPIWLAIFITALFIAFLSLYPALTGYLLNRFFPYTNTTKMVFAFPAIWFLMEWTRSWLFSGFPWLTLGYSQIGSPLKGYAPIFGVFGITLAVVMSAGLIINALIELKQKRRKFVYSSVIGLATIWIAGGILSFISWTYPEGKPVKVSLIQGNIPQELKWQPSQIQPTLDKYVALTEKHFDSNIIIWPEAAIPVSLQDAAEFINTLSAKAKEHGAALITGIPIRATTGDYYNGVIALGIGAGTYLKQRLVPFGEFTPFKKMLGKLLYLFDIPMSDMIPGKNNVNPISLENIRLATFVCYEIAFPELVFTRDGNIGLLLTVTNDAWFGHSIAQAQHLEMARMRALELGRPLLFVGNSGITAVINPNGKILNAAPAFQETVLTDFVQPTKGKTPWQYGSMDPILIICFLMLYFGWRWHKR